MRVEVMLDIFGDKIVSMHKELTWLGKEHRTTQKQRASTQVILSGWPNNCDPDERNGFIRWMCRECKGLCSLLFKWYKYEVDKDPTTITHILQVPPTTLSYPRRFGQKGYSPITILTFTNFDARQEYLNTFMGWQPAFEWSDGTRTDKRIRSAPASPDFQRQLEVPLRTIHKVLNNAPNTKGKQFITLWKSLTVMTPQDLSQHDDEHKACFKLEYTVHKNTGDVVAEMHITKDLAGMMRLKFDTQTQKLTDNQEANTLWQSCWQNQVTGREQEVTDATVNANTTVRTEGAYEIGQHWSQEFTKYTNTSFPFKIKLIVYPEDTDIIYNVEEYNKKMKNVSKNTQDRKQNTDLKGPQGNSTAGAWNNYKEKSPVGNTLPQNPGMWGGVNSQSSTGVSPTQGNAPTQQADPQRPPGMPPMMPAADTQVAQERPNPNPESNTGAKWGPVVAVLVPKTEAEIKAEAVPVPTNDDGWMQVDAGAAGVPVPKSPPTQPGPIASELLDPATLSPTQSGITAPPGDWSKDGGKGKEADKDERMSPPRNDANCGR
jgi:hypothetical protein